jgi:2-hydroxychromene-2-carboxylate isomerase
VHEVELYFDFVSPYTYLALTQVEAFGEQQRVDWRLRPVVYGALLDATELIGPAEVPIKRRYTVRDVTRTAKMLGVPLVGPPAHPFRSLEALRAVCLFLDRSEALRLVVALATACWGEGRDLTDIAVLQGVVADTGLPSDDLAERIVSPEVKAALRDATEAALAAGVFGVPTFRSHGELFWGQDRMGQLAARLQGALSGSVEEADAMEGRPRGADRRYSPLRVKPGDG